MLRKANILLTTCALLSFSSTLRAADSPPALNASQRLLVTVLGASFFSLDKEQMEVIFDSTEGLVQEKSVSSPYKLANIGLAREMTGSIDSLPAGITIYGTIGVPTSEFGEVQPTSIPEVEMDTTPKLMMSNIQRIIGTGNVSYRVHCDVGLADPTKLQAYPVVISYVMAVATATTL